MNRSSSGSPSGRASDRRRRLRPALALLAGLIPALVHPAPALAQTTPVLVVSRDRVLSETRAAKALRAAEVDLTARLQARVDKVKAELSAEEQELTRLRSTLPRDEFQARVQAFDTRVREERRQTQRRAAALQTAFRTARAQLVETLVPILIRVIREREAQVVLDADQILVAAPSADVTDRVIALFDEELPRPELPDLDSIEDEAARPPSPQPGNSP